MTVFVWAGTWAVNIEEMDVSNGPESGRNLAVILDPRTASLCQLVLLRFSGHLKMSAIMRTEVFHDEEEKLSTIQPRVQA